MQLRKPKLQLRKPNVISFNHTLSDKLDEKNSLLWKQQALAAIQGHKLEKFICGPKFWPERFLSTKSTLKGEENLKYLYWRKQDQLLDSWLLSSMTEAMLTQVVGCDRSYLIWNRIQEFFVSPTRAKIHQYKLQLRNTKKKGHNMNEYLLRINALVDGLVGCRHCISSLYKRTHRIHI